MSGSRCSCREQNGEKFRQCLLEAVDEGLSVLGEGAKFAAYYHIEKRYGLKRMDIPENIEVFQKALEGLFKDGASIIENRIAERLYGKLGLSLEDLLSQQRWTLRDHVERARKT